MLLLPCLAELDHLGLLLIGYGLANLISVVEAFHGSHHFPANHVALFSSLPTRLPSGASSRVATLVGTLSRHGAGVGDSALGKRRTKLLGQSEVRDHIDN
jgi:hypothetical protein